MATLLDADNYTKDTRPKEIQALNSVFDFVVDSKNGSGSIASPVTPSATGLVPIRQDLTAPSGILDLFFGIGAKESYRLDLVRDIILSFIFNITQIDLPSNHPDYTLPCYLYLARIFNDSELTPYGSNIDPLLIYPIGNISWSNSTGYTIATNPSRLFYLRNYIPARTLNLATGLYDFSNTFEGNANDRITKKQYEQIINEPSSFNANIFYDSTGLGGTVITHANNNLGPDGGYGGGSFAINLSFLFTFFGSSANYKPLQD